MQVIHDGRPWGEIEVQPQQDAVRFHATGALPKYGEILRVWGCGQGRAPLLIGVAEPDGDQLSVSRTLSKQYLASLDYWPALPEQFCAGVAPPTEKPSMSPLLRRILRQDGVEKKRDGDYFRLSCVFSADHAFPLAFAFCCCTVRNGRAALTWDIKQGCPERTAL